MEATSLFFFLLFGAGRSKSKDAVTYRLQQHKGYELKTASKSVNKPIIVAIGEIVVTLKAMELLGDAQDKILNHFVRLGDFSFEPSTDWCQIYVCATKNKENITKEVPKPIALAHSKEKKPLKKEDCVEKYRQRHCAGMSNDEFNLFLSTCESKSNIHMTNVFHKVGDDKDVIKTWYGGVGAVTKHKKSPVVSTLTEAFVIGKLW